MISFKNRDELTAFVERCADGDDPGEMVDELIAEMQEAGEVTAYNIHAERFLKNAAAAVDQLGETEGAALISAVAGVGYALLANGQNDEMFYATMIAQGAADRG